MKIHFLIWVSLFVASCLPTAVAQSTKLNKTKINDKITMGVPDDFVVMPQNAYQKKYGAYREPLAIYTSPDGKADLGVNQMANRLATAVAKADWKEEDLKILQGMYRASIKSLHTQVDFIQDKIELINKKNFIVFEFLGTVQDLDDDGKPTGRALKQYSYIQYGVQDNQVVIFNFNCPAALRSYHQETAKNIMHSIKLK
jgi:hypothetical protein